MDHHEKKLLFQEVQTFRNLWIILLVGVLTLTAWYAFIQQHLLGKSFGSNPAPDWLLLIIFILFGIILPVLLISAKLRTEVREDGLYVQFFPFHLRFHKIILDQVKSAETRVYKPIREYGGWGIRYGKRGKAYNVSGNVGLQLEFNNSIGLLIGSQRADELLEALKPFLNKSNDESL